MEIEDIFDDLSFDFKFDTKKHLKQFEVKGNKCWTYKDSEESSESDDDSTAETDALLGHQGK